jgi:FtsZ-binding cell division protein ZapB
MSDGLCELAAHCYDCAAAYELRIEELDNKTSILAAHYEVLQGERNTLEAENKDLKHILERLTDSYPRANLRLYQVFLLESAKQLIKET